MEKMAFHILLTDKPRITLVVLWRQREKVVVESANRMSLRQKGQSAFDLWLVPFGDEEPSGPSDGSHPAETVGQIVSPHGSHHARHFLVRTENDDSFGFRFRVEFLDDAVVSRFAGHARVLDQTLLDGDANVVLGQEHFKFLESLCVHTNI